MHNKVAEHTARHVSLITWLILISIAVLTLTVYAQTHDYAFVNFDDDVHVYENSHVNTGLSWINAVWAVEIHGPSQWHPLSWLSHQLDVELFGLVSGGHHLTNVLFHAANAMLLFLTLRYATGEMWPSAFVATVFAVHPLNVESVAWISERRNVLSMFFGILTILSYTQYTRHGRKGSYALVVTAYTLSLMAKPLFVTLPVALFLLDYWPLRRIGFLTKQGGETSAALESRNSLQAEPGWRLLILEKLPLLMLAAVSCLLTIWCQQSAGVVASTEKLPMVIRLINMVSAYGIYLRQMLVPIDLAVFYPHPGIWDPAPISALAVSAVIGSTILIVATTWCVSRLREHPYFAVGWFWYLGTLLPMVGLIQSGQQQMADRYMYLPMIGLLTAVAWGVQSFVKSRRSRRYWCHLALPAVVACMVISWRQVGYWQNSIALFRHAKLVTENNSVANNNLGLALHQQGRSIEAIELFNTALDIDPDYALAEYNLGVVWQDLKRIERSIPHFQRAIELNPAYVDAQLRLGAAFAQTNNLEDAIRQFELILENAPGHTAAHLNLGIAYGRIAEAGQAIEQFRIVLKTKPDDLRARIGLATGLRTLGELAEAEQHLLHLVHDFPRVVAVHCELGRLCTENGELARAATYFKQALIHDPDNIDATQQLQKLYVTAGSKSKF